MNTQETHTTHTTSATELRARKYAHAVDRNDTARRAHGDALAVLAVAVLTFSIAVAVLIASYVSSVGAFAFGAFGREVVRAFSLVATTGTAVVVGACVRDTRKARANYKSARLARAHACAELLSAF